jgi:hypothetical protein
LHFSGLDATLTIDGTYKINKNNLKNDNKHLL